MGKKLVFVYNAGSGLFEKATDFAHKIISPRTYSCNLCLIAYGNFGIKREWANFLKTLPLETAFFHKDAFQKEYPGISDGPFPAIFLDSGDGLREVISAEEINAQTDLAGLIGLVRRKLG
ncbi:MAG: hypothetical protein HZA04_02250 [Nitrospinae bacterium]|nr:hypothetical protein [Nitrospinota bacterium]